MWCLLRAVEQHLDLSLTGQTRCRAAPFLGWETCFGQGIHLYLTKRMNFLASRSSFPCSEQDEQRPLCSRSFLTPHMASAPSLVVTFQHWFRQGIPEFLISHSLQNSFQCRWITESKKGELVYLIYTDSHWWNKQLENQWLINAPNYDSELISTVEELNKCVHFSCYPWQNSIKVNTVFNFKLMFQTVEFYSHN